MTSKLDIETRLDRSLRTQVAGPRLDGRFDAAVWARIAAEDQHASQPKASARASSASGPARWMFIANMIGVSVSALLVIFFGMKAFTGVNVSMDVAVAVPQISPATMKEIAALSAQAITVAAVFFGLMFTPVGRRVRSIFS
jgi:hypothetical protein